MCVCVCVCVCTYVYIFTGSSVTIGDMETLGSKWCSLDWSFVEKTGDEGTSQACVRGSLLFLSRSISKS